MITQCLPLPDISLSVMPSRSIHVATNGRISFFLMLNNIPLCICLSIYTRICLYIHIYIYIYTHTLHFLIHSSADRHSSGFHILAIAMNMEVQLFLYGSLKFLILSWSFKPKAFAYVTLISWHALPYPQAPRLGSLGVT